jgi:hypothetical protein
MISPQMNLFSKSVWITPAACGAFVPLRIVQARTSSGPQVKYRISWVPGTQVLIVSTSMYRQRHGELTSKDIYPACVILPSALVAPRFFSSSALSSVDKGASRSSRATEKGMSGSPGLLASIQALIRGSLKGFESGRSYMKDDRKHHLFFLRT